jgi:hypothetical protein
LSGVPLWWFCSVGDVLVRGFWIGRRDGSASPPETQPQAQQASYGMDRSRFLTKHTFVLESLKRGALALPGDLLWATGLLDGI